MFTGIVGPMGTIQKMVPLEACIQFTITPHTDFTDLVIGESIAVNGACLTVTHFSPQSFDVTLVPETLRKTNLGLLQEGSLVNLERSLQLSSRLGGHYVQGHVDAVAEIIDWRNEGDDVRLATLRVPPALAKYIVNKGYVAIDGMSITVINSTDDLFTVTLVPHTLQVTIAQQYQTGTVVNLEVDILSKYIEKLIGVPSCNPT